MEPPAVCDQVGDRFARREAVWALDTVDEALVRIFCQLVVAAIEQLFSNLLLPLAGLPGRLGPYVDVMTRNSGLPADLEQIAQERRCYACAQPLWCLEVSGIPSCA